MAEYVMVRDLRVHAGIPSRPNLGIINTDARTPLSWVFQRINAYARLGRIHALFVLAHGRAGFDAKPRTDGFTSYEGPGGVCKDAGGMGVSVGTEGIRHGNVEKWYAIRGKAENIVLYSCGAADTQPGNEFSLADGRYLMGALAICTGANVYAASAIQYFSKYKHLPNGRFILSDWRGVLYHFPPDGTAPKAVPGRSLAFDFNEVMARR
jgi:hypothetical protein